MSWTLDQLAERAARALVDAEVRVANGRVTGVPDRRLIRWYATIGLLDRPLIGPGRAARYGQRHLLQLVAVKRLQAQGLPLAEIQLRLAGATDATLRRIAALPPGLDDGELDEPGADPGRGDMARSAPLRHDLPGATPGDGVSLSDTPGPVAQPTRFWAARPGPAAPAGRVVPTAVLPGLVERVDGAPDTVRKVHGLRIGGLTLLLPSEPGPGDLDAIAAAARPLLDLLADRGLLAAGWSDPDGPDGRPHPDGRSPS